MLALLLTKRAWRGHSMEKLETAQLHGTPTNVGIVANSTHQCGKQQGEEVHARKWKTWGSNFSPLYNNSKRSKCQNFDGKVFICNWWRCCVNNNYQFFMMPARIKGRDMDIVNNCLNGGKRCWCWATMEELLSEFPWSVKWCSMVETRVLWVSARMSTRARVPGRRASFSHHVVTRCCVHLAWGGLKCGCRSGPRGCG